MADEELATLTDLRAGRVRLAACPSAAATLVPRAVAALRRQHPDVEVALTQAEPPEAVAMVQAGDADLALVFSYGEEPLTNGGMVWRPLGSEVVDLIVGPGHPLVRKGGFSVDDLAEEQWIVGCQRCRAHAVALCAEAGFEPDVRHVSDDYVVVQNLVAVGLGAALLPRSALEAFQHPGVEVLPSSALGSRTFGVVHPVGAETVPATAAMIAVLGAE